MKKLLLTLGLLLLVVKLTSQELPKIVPPSPNAAALSKHVDVPVSHYTGIPNISIPIYTIQQNEISIPISLSYHSRGIQLSEVAPSTGQGWSLQYGGSMSRQIRGKADESPNSGFLQNKYSFINYFSHPQARETANVQEQENPDWDFYPDQFSFSAGNFSGKFVLSYVDEQPLIQSFDDIKITYTIGYFGHGQGITSFKVFDSKGNIYYFGISKDGLRTAQDYQISNGMNVYFSGNVILDSGMSYSEIVPSSWKLMDIETPNGDLISYHYEASNLSAYYRKSFDKHVPNYNPQGNLTNSVENMGNIFQIFSRISRVDNYEKDLRKIVFNQGRDSVVFIKSLAGRLDYDGFPLEKISIYNKGKLIKSHKLNYQYSHSTDNTNMLSYFVNNGFFSKLFYRMFLSSIEEEGNNGQKLPPYVFTYNFSEPLPSMFSSKQDYWGFYNGATDNGPFTRMFEYGTFTPNRRVDTLKSEIGLLKEIKYPTGGKTKLTYEHNKGAIPLEFNDLLIPNTNPSANNTVEIELTKSDFTFNGIPTVIQMPSNTKIKYRFNCFHLRDFNDPNNEIIPDCLFSFTLNGNGVNINEYLEFYTPSSSTGYVSTNISALAPRFPNVDPNLYLGRIYDFSVTISYVIPDNKRNLYGPGKRIKKIEQTNENGTTSIKEYEYVYAVDPSIGGNPTPSGSIIGLPSYLSGKRQQYGYTIYGNYNDATSAYSSFQPNTIGYSSVIEYQGTKENNIGKIEYTFTNINDTGGDYYEFPYHPPTDNEWLRGKNVNTKYFSKNENGEYLIEKEIYNKYLYHNAEFTNDLLFGGFLNATNNLAFTPAGSKYEFTQNANEYFNKTRTLLKMPLFMRQKWDFTNPDPYQITGYRVYHLTGGTQHLLRTTEKNYSDNGVLETTTTYNYDYNKHYQVKGTEIIDSRNKIVKTINYYPVDKLNLTGLSSEASTALDNLVLNNRFELIQTDILNDNILQSKVRTNFKVWSGLKIVAASNVQASKGTQALEDRIIYHSYDSKGNPQEVSKKDGTKIYYVWGYNQTQPIAKIEGYTNAQLANVQSLITAAVTASNNDNDTCKDSTTSTCNEKSLRIQLNNLRNSPHLVNAQVTSFTYDPLIGVTSITDPRGQIIYYEYDNFNRLKQVVDKDDNILSKNEYHYKN